MSLINCIRTVIILTVLILLPAVSAFAQQTQQPGATVNMDDYSRLAGEIVFLLVAFMFILFLILSAPKYNVSAPGKPKKATAFKKFRQVITQAVPLEKEEDIMFDHDFDGIKELDNKIPPWFNFLFIGTVLFAVVYLLVYHVTGSGKLMADEYVDEILTAQKQRDELIRTGALINENTVTLLTDAASLDNGKNVFTTNCVPCHGPNGGGVVGPNLTDDYWIHGGGIMNVFKTIKYGVPIKGMISWQTQLNPKKMQEVASYVISLHGTNPPGGKPPEGTIWTDSTQTKTPGDSSKTVLKKTDSLKTDLKTDTTKKAK
jgi:cytochrome c oxidase cbb3-type subunit 3